MGYAVIQDPKTGIVTFDSRLFDLDPDQQEQIRWIDKQIFQENMDINRQGIKAGECINPKLSSLIATRKELMQMWSGYSREIAPWPADEREERIAGLDRIGREWAKKVTDY